MTLKTGVATVNITPSVGFDNMGDYLNLIPAKGVRNELFAKATYKQREDEENLNVRKTGYT